MRVSGAEDGIGLATSINFSLELQLSYSSAVEFGNEAEAKTVRSVITAYDIKSDIGQQILLSVAAIDKLQRFWRGKIE